MMLARAVLGKAFSDLDRPEASPSHRDAVRFFRHEYPLLLFCALARVDPGVVAHRCRRLADGRKE